MKDSRFIIGRWLAALLALCGFGFAIYQVVVDNMPKGEVRVIEGYTAWPEEVLELAETLPVQDGGRIKPLSTYAGFAMLGMHGARSMKIDDGSGNVVKLKPTGWMLDTLFRPQLAVKQPTFRVDNSDALKAIGVDSRSRRDRYSYEEIEPGRDKLVDLAEAYAKIDSEKRDPMQTQVVDLASNVRTYEALFGYFLFARSGVLLRGFGENGDVDKRADMSAMMVTAPQLREHLQASQGRQINPGLRALLDQVLHGANYSKFGLFLLPPKGDGKEKWKSAGEAIMGVMSESSNDPETAIHDIAKLETLARSVGDDEAFLKALQELHGELSGRAAERGEYKHVELEASYYKRDWFLNAMVFFLLGSLTTLAMWMFGGSLAGRVCHWSTVVLTLLGTVYCVIAIVIRCIIMERPPIGNLYDTIIFIAATVGLLSLLTELMTRRRFALGVGPILGTALILLARRYELGDAQDHMDPLVAVLDSNYWLTTHVITITLGYSGGLLSAFLSAGYVIARGFGLDHGKGQKEFRRSLTRAVYGMLCLTLFLSLVGTVLGGIWANDSWGRFWGWDPKENGALLIVLWTLAILHARMGGYIREWGLHLASLFTAVVVTFSWWHVNFLGVGLHNYGFTAGKNAIWVFYCTILVALAFGVGVMLWEKLSRPKTVDHS